MTIPAIAPPLRPLLVTVTPAAALPSVPIGVWKGIVVVAVPVEVTVTTVLLVGRIPADADTLVGAVLGTKTVLTALAELPPYAAH